MQADSNTMPPEADIVIANGTVVDGTGASPRHADVGIRGDRVVAIGDLTEWTWGQRIPADGLVVAPGFVDVHSHSDLALLSDGRARSKIRQGVTTEVTGNCGMSPFPCGTGDEASVRRAIGIIDPDASVPWAWSDLDGYAEALHRAEPALNVAPLTGHVAARVAVGATAARPATASERSRIAGLVDRMLASGSVGVSTGLMYPPAMWADHDELCAIGEIAASYGRLFAVHLRNYSDALVPAVDEALDVARSTGCRLQISHLAVAGRRNWGAVAVALEHIGSAGADGVDVGVDIYPYLAGSANLSQLLPAWSQEGGAEATVARLGRPAVRDRIRSEWTGSPVLGWEEVEVAAITPDLEHETLGRTIAAIAAAWGLDPADTALELIRRSGDRALMTAYGRSEADLHAVLRHPATAIGSDGLALDPDGPSGHGRPHPRSYGCYPRVLARIVREQALLPLETAVSMATARPADRVGLHDRGRLAAGAVADVVVFDPVAILDNATFEHPSQFPDGIRHVVVNGVPVVEDGRQHDDRRPGRILLAGR